MKNSKNLKKFIKNSFINLKIIFFFDLNFKYFIKEEEIENYSKYFQFSKKLLNEKLEIKLNNFFKNKFKSK